MIEQQRIQQQNNRNETKCNAIGNQKAVAVEVAIAVAVAEAVAVAHHAMKAVKQLFQKIISK